MPARGKFRSLIENTADGVAIISAEGKPTYISPTATKVMGYTFEDFSQLDLFSIIHPDDVERAQEVFAQAFANPGVPVRGHTAQMLHKDGTWRWMEAVITNMLHDPAVNGFVDNFRDVTERVLAEKKITRINHLYGFISEISQLIVYQEDEQSLFDEVCRLAVEFGKIDIAWIGILDTENQKVNLVAQTGMNPEDLCRFRDTIYAPGGPQDVVLATGTYYICNDIENKLGLVKWKPVASKRNWNSVITLPIKKGGKIIATFNLYTSELNFFNNEECVLLTEATHQISLALDVFEQDRLRQEAEEKLRANNLRLSKAQEIANYGGYEVDFASGIGLWSAQFCHIYGIPPQESEHSFAEWLSFIVPEDLERVKSIIADANDTLSTVNYYFRIKRKDGSLRHIHSYRHIEYNKDGQPTGAYAVAHDITDAHINVEQLKAQNQQLREIAWLQSHKVRAPLATILGLAGLFKNEDSGVPQKEIVDMMITASEKLDEVISEVVSKTASFNISETER